MAVFRAHEQAISTETLAKGLTSDQVLAVLCGDLISLGFEVERGKRQTQKIKRPVFFGENGVPTVQYEIDGFHRDWKCGIEVEAGRAWMGNAVYRDLILASVMVDVEYFCLAVPNAYKYQSRGNDIINKSYAHTQQLADALYGHSRMRLPYRLLVIGY